MHYLWDPIGVASVPEARVEYQGYLPRVFGMLKDGGDEVELAQALCDIATERMGLSARPDHHRMIARHLLVRKTIVSNGQA